MAVPITKPKPSANGKTAKEIVALAELTNEPREGDFRGVKIALPPKLPATFALDMAEVQATQGGADMGPMYRLIVGLIGSEQWRAVRDSIATTGESMDDLGEILKDLVVAVTAPYGMEPGE